MRRRQLAALACLLPVLPARAAPAAAGVVLSLAGAPGGPREWTLEELEALGMAQLVTVTPWTRSPQRYSGVPLLRLMQAVAAPPQASLRAEALNRYAVEVPAQDVWHSGAMLATRLDGEPMRVRDRGPIWLIYPWTYRPELDRPDVNERSIWQLRRIELR